MSNTKIEELLAIPSAEVGEEVEAVLQFTHERIKNLDGFEHQKKGTVQLLALGAIFLRWIQDNPEEHREAYMKLAWGFAQQLTRSDET